MQTFLPYPDLRRTARVLDTRRLGKQRVEAFQILRAFHVPGYGWRHHPAVRMWRGYEDALASYGMEICGEWVARGHADTVLERIRETHGRGIHTEAGLRRRKLLPPWFGDPAFHRSHQSALVRKDPGRYRRFFPDVPDDLPYIWPSIPPSVGPSIPPSVGPSDGPSGPDP